MYMTETEILREYRQAKNKGEQIKVLADLNLCDREKITEILTRCGETVPAPAALGRRWKENSRSWDEEKVRALYEEGRHDLEIAAAVGVSKVTVFRWRHAQGLPPNGTRRPVPPPENTASASELSEPPEIGVGDAKLAPPSRPLALPITKGPVEMSVEMGGHAFSLRAPDLEGAERIYEYAGRLLKDMGQATAKLKEETYDA